MLIRLSAIVLICFASLVAPASDIVSVDISVLKAAIGNTNSITVNSSTRTFTNTITTSPGTLIQETNTAGLTATNLINHLGLYQPSGIFSISATSPTNIVLRSRVGSALVVSVAGGWATVTATTNAVTSPTFNVRLPITVEAATNQTNIASMLVTALERATNNLSTNNTALANYVSKGASALQEVISPVLFSGGVRGKNALLTNGYTSGLTNINPVSSNLVNYGNAIRSEGSGGNSLQVGSNALSSGSMSTAIGNSSAATGARNVAIGNSASATNTDAMAIGTSAQARTNDTIAIGNGAIASGSAATAVGRGSEAVLGGVAMGEETYAWGVQSTALGNAASAVYDRSVAIGYTAAANHSNSVALGQNATTTSTNQIRLGTSTETVSIPGVLYAVTTTNLTATGTNHIAGDLSFGRYSNTSIVNGNNAGIVIGTNVIVELSGGTTIAQYAGFVASRDGDERIVRMSGPVTNIVVNEVDGTWSTDGTAARRIVTGTGASLALTNNPSWIRMIYRSASSRWEVTTHSR